MVVGWLEVTTESNLGNCKTNQENFTFAGKISLTYVVAKPCFKLRLL